jgi:hypothetical protein
VYFDEASGRLVGHGARGVKCWAICTIGRSVAQFDVEAIGIRTRWVRLESASDMGPWFRWASVGVDSAATLAGQVGLTLAGLRLIGSRVIASLTAR